MNAPKLDFEQREQVERILQCSDDDLWNEVATLVLADAQLAEKERTLDDLRERGVDFLARAEAAEQRLQEAQARWELYEREYILPQFGWAEELGIDLKQLVHDNAGKNCAQLFYEALRERLRQREAELEQRWIAVGERLPEDCQTVLATNMSDVVSYEVVTHVCEYEVAAPNGIHSLTRFRYMGTLKEFKGVTHWQPLPSPPKVQP